MLGIKGALLYRLETQLGGEMGRIKCNFAPDILPTLADNAKMRQHMEQLTLESCSFSERYAVL